MRASRRASILRVPAAGHSAWPKPIAIPLFRRLKQERKRERRKGERGTVRDRGSERAKGRGRDRDIDYISPYRHLGIDPWGCLRDLIEFLFPFFGATFVISHFTLSSQ